MFFHWDDENLAHIARHNVSPSQAEEAFGAEDAVVRQDPNRLNRWILEASLGGRTLKVAFAQVFPEGLRVITAHWLSSRRRRLP